MAGGQSARRTRFPPPRWFQEIRQKVRAGIPGGDATVELESSRIIARRLATSPGRMGRFLVSPPCFSGPASMQFHLSPT